MYYSFLELSEQAEQAGKSLAEVILENECEVGERSETDICSTLKERLDIMFSSSKKALHTPQTMPGNLIAGQSARQNTFAHEKNYLGKPLNQMLAHALSSSEVNASMGVICAAPTAGACGILPAALLYAMESLTPSQKELEDALLVASGVGAIITKNATVSGAEGGCQAECGSAAAMAAAALVTLRGGSHRQVDMAIAIALMNCMGLICDPVAGLVQLPCSFRNASQAMNAVLSADMAMANQDPFISADSAILSMGQVGKMLPAQLRETAQGGIATSPDGEILARQIGSENENFQTP